MSKAVLISIKPKWCEKIANGEKTIEVRKTKPNIKVPFKCYIYETTAKVVENVFCLRCTRYGKGLVIGEFICDKIEDFNVTCISEKPMLGYQHFINNGTYKLEDNKYVVFERNDRYIDTMLNNVDLEKMCLTYQELLKYAGGFGKHIYGYHITNLKIYDKPKELSEFRKKMNCYQPGNEESIGCWEKCCIWQAEGLCTGKYTTLVRPPQSWCYVEDLGD